MHGGEQRTPQLCPLLLLHKMSAALAAAAATMFLQLELPLTNAFDAGKTAACVQLLHYPEAPGRLKPGAIEPVLSIRDLEVPVVSGRTYQKASRAKKAVASCK